MEKQNEEKGFQLTEKGEEIYANQKQLNKDAKHPSQGRNKYDHRLSSDQFPGAPSQQKAKKPTQSEQVSRFIDEGNPNTQPVNPQAQQSNQTEALSEYSILEQNNKSSFRGAIAEESEQETQKAELEFEKDTEEQRKPAEIEDVAQEIKEDILRDSTLADVNETIYVTVENGVATLSGKVTTEQQKINAGNKAISHMGSDKVKNYINVTSYYAGG